jgi:hypothetical protein
LNGKTIAEWFSDKLCELFSSALQEDLASIEQDEKEQGARQLPETGSLSITQVDQDGEDEQMVQPLTEAENLPIVQEEPDKSINMVLESINTAS